MESIINHIQDKASIMIMASVSLIIPELVRHDRLHKIKLMASLHFQLYCGSVKGVSNIMMKAQYDCSIGMLSKLMVFTMMENIWMYSMAGSFFLRHARSVS